MRNLVALMGAVAVVGCAPIGGVNGGPALSPSNQLLVAKTEYGAEVLYQFAGNLYLKYGAQLPAADKAQVKGWLGMLETCDTASPPKCTGALPAVRAAQKAGNATDLGTQLSAVSTLANQVMTVIHTDVPASASETPPAQ